MDSASSKAVTPFNIYYILIKYFLGIIVLTIPAGHDASDEPGCPTTFNFDFEVVEDVGEMRKMILDEVARFRQHVRIQPGQVGANQGPAVPIPQGGATWEMDPRPQEYGQGATGLEQDLQGGLDAMHG